MQHLDKCFFVLRCLKAQGLCPVNHNHQGTSHGVALGLDDYCIIFIIASYLFIYLLSLHYQDFVLGQSFFVLPVISQ